MEIHLSPQEGDVVSIEVRHDLRTRASLLTVTSYEACRLLLQDYEFNELLDIGSGQGQHSEIFRAYGKRVTTIDASAAADIQGDYLSTRLPHQWEAIWCSHVLEHQRNVGSFLDKLYDDLSDGGVLAITVPPVTSHWISSQHCNWFNAGMLLYHLVMAGFNCREARVLTYRYNMSVLLEKVPTGRSHMTWALELTKIEEFLPPRIVRDGGMNGAIHSYLAKHTLEANPHPAAAIDYAAGEVRYLIATGQLARARSVLAESLTFNPRDASLLELKSQLDERQEA